MNRLLPIVVAFCSACGETPGDAVSLPLTGSGSGESTFTQGAWQITLDRAEVGFGPLYLCAASLPSDHLCETALVEMNEVVTIDALNPSLQQLSVLEGTTGVVRSAVFDYGVSWPLTFRSPRPGAGAPGGHSARFGGSATDGVRTLVFTADIDVLPSAVGRLTSGAVTEHTIDDGASRLHVVLEPVRWWRNVDFDALAAFAFADVDPDDPQPTVSLHVADDSTAYGAIVHEMSAGARPRFTWSRD